MSKAMRIINTGSKKSNSQNSSSQLKANQLQGEFINKKLEETFF